jgi:hypothetical protein
VGLIPGFAGEVDAERLQLLFVGNGGGLFDALCVFALGARLPKKYNRRKVIKWAKRYDWLFQHRLPK